MDFFLSLSSSVTDFPLSFGSTIVTCLIIIFSPSLCDAGLLLKIKPQQPHRTKNPKMAESPMAAPTPWLIGSVVLT